nr:hypothetical protein [Spirochaetales bacterium]
MDIAKQMRLKYKPALDVAIFTTDSEEAEGYTFRSATTVLFNDEVIPIDIATDKTKLETFLS